MIKDTRMAAKQLKGVILSVEDTIMNMGKIDATVFTEVEKLMAFFKLRGLKPVLLANKEEPSPSMVQPLVTFTIISMSIFLS